MEKIKILCNNDSMEVAIVSAMTKKQLNIILEDRAKKHYETVKHNIAGVRWTPETDDKAYEEYRRFCYWHYHDVEVIQ